MSQPINLVYIDRTIGSVALVPDVRELTASRSADGIVLHFPAVCRFDGDPSHEPQRYLCDLCLTATFDGIEVGHGSNFEFLWGYGQHDRSIRVELTARSLVMIERQRNGGAAMFRLELVGKTGVVDINHEPRVLSMPNKVSGVQSIEIDRDRWIGLLRSTGWGNSVVTEIAIPHSAEPPWDGVLKSLQSARDALDMGGQLGWKACVTECRHVLEQWEKIAPLNIDPQAKPRDLARAQRLDAVRQSLYRYACDSVHSSRDLTSRSEAVMVLGTVAGLLGVYLGG